MCVGILIEIKNNEFWVVIILVGVVELICCGYEVFI